MIPLSHLQLTQFPFTVQRHTRRLISVSNMPGCLSVLVSFVIDWQLVQGCTLPLTIKIRIGCIQ